MFMQPYTKQYRFGFITTSDIEIHDLLRAWIAISLAFAIMLSNANIFSSQIIYYFFLAALSVGVGFIFHEMGHKIVAQHYGCFAEFRANNFMLWLAILMSFFGFLFAAPGAVMIQGPVGTRRNGKISMAGPMMNLVIALVLLSNILIFPLTGFVRDVFLYGFMINSWLALFNMIPIGNFDGRKILTWNKVVYGAMVAAALIFMLVQSFVLKA